MSNLALRKAKVNDYRTRVHHFAFLVWSGIPPMDAFYEADLAKKYFATTEEERARMFLKCQELMASDYVQRKINQFQVNPQALLRRGQILGVTTMIELCLTSKSEAIRKEAAQDLMNRGGLPITKTVNVSSETAELARKKTLEELEGRFADLLIEHGARRRALDPATGD